MEIMDYITNAINDADEESAKKRVRKLQERYPNDSPDAPPLSPADYADKLTNILIKQKCFKTGAVGAVTSAASIVPGLGTVASFTFGTAVDIGVTFKMQAELVLEISAVYQYKLEPSEKQNIVLIVTGVSAGANKLATKVGEQIAKKATKKLLEKSVAKAIPVFGVVASAGTNILSTYIIGKRAQAYFNMKSMDSWEDIIKVSTGVDVPELSNWLAETTEHSWELIKENVAGAGDAFIIGANKTGELVVYVGAGISDGAGKVRGIAMAGTNAVIDFGKRTGTGIADSAGKVGETAMAGTNAVIDFGKRTGVGIADGAGKVGETAMAGTNAVIDFGKKAGAGIADGAGKVGETAMAGKNTVIDLGKKAGAGIADGAGKIGGTATYYASKGTSGVWSAIKTILGKKGDASSIPVNQLTVTLKWTANVDLDLMAFYKGKNGQVGGVFSNNYQGSTLGDLNAFPFIELSGDAGVGATEGNKEETLRITKLDDLAELFIVTLNYTDVIEHKESVFSHYDGAVFVASDTNETIAVPLNSPNKGEIAVICKIENNDSTGARLININDIMSLESFLKTVPGSGLIMHSNESYLLSLKKKREV